jgi:hypothetical protein
MKKLILLLTAATLTTGLWAQKGKDKKEKKSPAQKETTTARSGSSKIDEAREAIKKDGKTASSKTNEKENVGVWEGTSGNGDGPKPSKNQPAKVRAAFERDYPSAANVSWSKYRGDWTATFRNGLLTSTAVYHANGDRRDTRTLVTKRDLPSVILEQIKKKRPGIQLGDIIKIQVPGAVKDIFRVKTIEVSGPRFLYYNAEGKEVKYDY